MLTRLRRVLAPALLAALMSVLSAGPASGAVYETPPPFCNETVLHDYLAPLERMPKLHAPTPTGGLGFGPESVRIRLSPQLIVGKGRLGYTLSRRHLGQSVHLDWDIETVLSRVDWRGRTIDIKRRTSRHLDGLWRGHAASTEFGVNGEPATYRLTVTFSARSGRRLGKVGLYFRVVSPVKRTSFSLNAASYRRGQTVFGRLENFGTAAIFFGEQYAIERLEGAEWIRAPESPKAFILPLYGIGAGQTSKCFPFRIPITMPGGHYRMSKEFGYGVNRNSPSISAEFEVQS